MYTPIAYVFGLILNFRQNIVILGSAGQCNLESGGRSKISKTFEFFQLRLERCFAILDVCDN